MKAIFIRHGESTGNAGIPSHDLATIELTERGREQARAVAASWTEAPALIVTSPYTRTRQTAAPTIARFPGVPVEAWPIEEFTYLQPARWNGTRSAERMPHLHVGLKPADLDPLINDTHRDYKSRQNDNSRCQIWDHQSNADALAALGCPEDANSDQVASPIELE